MGQENVFPHFVKLQRDLARERPDVEVIVCREHKNGSRTGVLKCLPQTISDSRQGQAACRFIVGRSPGKPRDQLGETVE